MVSGKYTHSAKQLKELNRGFRWLKKGGIYQWRYPETAAGGRFEVKYITQREEDDFLRVYGISYLTAVFPTAPGILEISVGFIARNFHNLIVQFEPLEA